MLFSWNCSLICLEICTFLGHQVCLNMFLYSLLLLYSIYKVSYTRVWPELYELKSIRLEYNLLPKGGKKVENFDFWGIFELFDQTGYCFIFGPKGDKSPSLVKICTFCRLVFVIFFCMDFVKFLIKWLAGVWSHELII